MIVLKAVSWSSITTSRSKYFWYSSPILAFSSNDFLMSSSWKKRAWGKGGVRFWKNHALVKSTLEVNLCARDLYKGVVCIALHHRPLYILSGNTKRRIWKIYVHTVCSSGRKYWSLCPASQGSDKKTQATYVQMLKEDEIYVHQVRALLTSCPLLRQISGSANWSRVALRTSHGFYTVCCYLTVLTFCCVCEWSGFWLC